MTFTVFHGRAAVRDAIKKVAQTLQHGALKYRRRVVFRPSSLDVDVHWNPQHRFWTHLRMLNNRPWLATGTVDPSNSPKLFIRLEFNPGFHDSPLGFGGLFARDSGGSLCLLHTGKMGGGQKGLTKSGFLSALSPRVVEVRLPDGRSTKAALVGRVDADRFPLHFADFLTMAAAYKDGRAQQNASLEISPASLSFSPEFFGPSASYVPGTVDPICDHGLLVNRLHAELAKLGLKAFNDPPGQALRRDLFICGDRNHCVALFEIKTDFDPSSIYAGIGQLTFYTALDKPPPKRFLVLPAGLPQRISQRLRQCGISVLSYEWQGDLPVFANLDSVLPV